MNDTTRCAATDEGRACRRPVLHATPVPLCEAHRIEIALAVVPDLLRGSLITATLDPSAPPRLDLVEHATGVDHEALLALDVHDPVVYFVANGGRVKIGYSTNLASRLATLTLRPDNVLLTLVGGPELERALHTRFAAHRQGHSEWFDLAPELVRYIAKRPVSDAPTPRPRAEPKASGTPVSAVSAPASSVPTPRPRRNIQQAKRPASPIPAHHIATARAILEQDPSTSGEKIGKAIGTSPSYGRRVKNAALNTTA